MSDINYTGKPYDKSFYDKLDKQRKERDKSDKEFFQVVSGYWSDDILPEGERPKYELDNTKAYIDAMKEGQRKFSEEAAPLLEKLCVSYDTTRTIDADDCQYLGVISRVKDHQKLMNMRVLEVSNNMAIMKGFDSWFNNYSFSYVPKFCKQLIKKWLFAAYKAGVKLNDK